MDFKEHNNIKSGRNLSRTSWTRLISYNNHKTHHSQHFLSYDFSILKINLQTVLMHEMISRIIKTRRNYGYPVMPKTRYWPAILLFEFDKRCRCIFFFPSLCLPIIPALLHIYPWLLLPCTIASYSHMIRKPRLSFRDSLLIQKDFSYFLAWVSTSNRSFHTNTQMIK